MRVHVSGMSCNHCKMVVEKCFYRIKGVKKVEVDLKSGVANIEVEGRVNESDFRDALKDTAYEVAKVEL